MERMLSRAPDVQASGPGSEALDCDEVVEQPVEQWFSSPSEHHDSHHLDRWAVFSHKETKLGQSLRQTLADKKPWREKPSRGVGSHGLGSTAAVLAPLARKCLVVPGVNGSIDRVCSVGRRVLASSRHCLAGARVCQLLRLKRNSELVGM